MTFIQDFCDLVRFLYFKTEQFPNLKTEVDSYMKVIKDFVMTNFTLKLHSNTFMAVAFIYGLKQKKSYFAFLMKRKILAYFSDQIVLSPYE